VNALNLKRVERKEKESAEFEGKLGSWEEFVEEASGSQEEKNSTK